MGIVFSCVWALFGPPYAIFGSSLKLFGDFSGNSWVTPLKKHENLSCTRFLTFHAGKFVKIGFLPVCAFGSPLHTCWKQ